MKLKYDHYGGTNNEGIVSMRQFITEISVLNMEGEISWPRVWLRGIEWTELFITHEKIGEEKWKNEVPMESHREAIARCWRVSQMPIMVC